MDTQQCIILLPVVNKFVGRKLLLPGGPAGNEEKSNTQQTNVNIALPLENIIIRQPNSQLCFGQGGNDLTPKYDVTAMVRARRT